MEIFKFCDLPVRRGWYLTLWGSPRLTEFVLYVRHRSGLSPWEPRDPLLPQRLCQTPHILLWELLTLCVPRLTPLSPLPFFLSFGNTCSSLSPHTTPARHTTAVSWPGTGEPLT